MADICNDTLLAYIDIVVVTVAHYVIFCL